MTEELKNNDDDDQIEELLEAGLPEDIESNDDDNDQIDELDEDFEDSTGDDDEEDDGEFEEEPEASDRVEVSLSKAKVDDDGEFDYLFEDEEQKQEKSHETANSKAKSDNNISADSEELPKHLQSGTTEYFKAVKTYAENKVIERLGVGSDGEPIEYDQFDDEHRVMFDHFVSEAKKLVSEESSKIATKRKQRKQFSEASGKVDEILATKELGDKYVAVCENMKVKDKKKLDEQVARGDYSGYIKLAERVRNTYGKAKEIQNRSKTTRLSKKHSKSLDDSLAFMGY